MQRSHRDIPHSADRIKWKRRKIVWKLAGVFFVTAFVVTGIIWVISRPELRIARIEVSGNAVLGNEEIISVVHKEIGGTYFYLFPKDSFFFYPKTRIENNLLSSFKRVLSLKVSAQSFTVLSVVINERKPHSLWCGEKFFDKNNEDKNTPCYFMDETGFLFSEAPRFSDNVYMKFYGPLYEARDDLSIADPLNKHVQVAGTSTETIIPVGAMFLPSAEFKTINLFRDLFERIGFKINKIVAMDVGDFVLRMSEGGRILINKKQDAMRLTSDIESAFQTELGDPKDFTTRKQIDYIDARFANKIFFKKNK